MTTDRFSHRVHIAAPPAKIYAYLLDPNSYVGLSPLVVAVRDVRPDGAGTAYVAVERFRVGMFHWDNLIRVTTTGTVPDAQVVSAVISPAAVRLTSTVDLVPDGDGTAVTESVEVRSPWLLRRFVLGQATSVQRARLAELTRRLQA
jgi:hypothetical protein